MTNPTTGATRVALAAILALVCWAALPARSAEYRQLAPQGHTLKDYRQIVLNGHTMKWGAPVLGTGAIVTYAVVGREQSFGAARNCPVIDPMGRLLAANGIAETTFAHEVDAAFAAWTAVAGVRFQRVDPAEADILIGAQAQPRSRAFTNVVYDDRAPTATELVRLTSSVICLNPDEPWKVGFDGNLDVYDLRYTLTHEIGHAIGLDHPGRAGELMDFRYTEEFRVPQLGDIAGATFLYGPNAVLTASRSGVILKVNDAAAR